MTEQNQSAMPVEITPRMLAEANELVMKHFPGLTREQIDKEAWIKARNRFVSGQGVYHQHLVGYLGEIVFREVLRYAGVNHQHMLAHARKDIGYDFQVITQTLFRVDVKTRCGVLEWAREQAFTIPEGQHEKTDFDLYAAVMVTKDFKKAWVLGVMEARATKTYELKREAWMSIPARIIPQKALTPLQGFIRAWQV